MTRFCRDGFSKNALGKGIFQMGLLLLVQAVGMVSAWVRCEQSCADLNLKFFCDTEDMVS